MCTSNANCCNPACIGSGGTLDGGNGKELVKINLCQPLRQLCDDAASTIFFSGPIPSINGVFTVNNKSSECSMTIEVTDANGAAVQYTVLPGSSIAVAVESVTLIEYFCTGTDPTDVCTGSFEANFYYCVDC